MKDYEIDALTKTLNLHAERKDKLIKKIRKIIDLKISKEFQAILDLIDEEV